MRRLKTALLAGCLLFGYLLFGGAAAASSARPVPAAFAPNVVHAEPMQVGPHRLSVQFTSTWPPSAQKAFDLIFAPDTGIQTLGGRWQMVGPDGQVTRSGDLLPRYPRDRRYWGLDAVSFPAEGRNLFVVTIGPYTGSLAVQVGPPPAGPPRLLISLLALLPVLWVLVLAVRAWRRTSPLRQLESGRW